MHDIHDIHVMHDIRDIHSIHDMHDLCTYLPTHPPTHTAGMLTVSPVKEEVPAELTPE